jgi:drug/metabolite transporter (DMT)-like permease
VELTRLNSQALPYIILLGFIWGSNLVVARFGLEQINPLTFVGLRLALASVAHLVVYAADRRRQWPVGRVLWRQAAVLGVLGTAVPMTSLIMALQYQSSGVTSIFITTGPAITVLMAHFFLADEPLTRRKSVGVALALGGALLLALQGESGLPDVAGASLLGFGLVIMGMVFGSAMAIYARKHLRHFDAFDVATVRMFVATLSLAPLVILVSGVDLRGVNTAGYFSLGYTALVGAFAGLLLEFYVIKRFGATAAVMTAYVIPVVATIGGVLFLGERMTVVMVGGMGLIILGIAIINRRRRTVRRGIIPPT